MKKTILYAALTMTAFSSFAQNFEKPTSAPQQKATAKNNDIVFDEGELSDALSRILEAAPGNFDKLYSGKTFKNEYVRDGLEFEGTVGMSNCGEPPKITVGLDNKWYYNFYLVNKIKKDYLKPNADAAEPIILKALGKGARVADRTNEQGLITVNFRNPSRQEWIQMSVMPWGTITIFVFNAPV